ncbi:MAG: hypothetical protein JJU00_14895 [Opitutales bacterium]|nr:hypothetical protein [Opitutales bacterium]
MIILHTALAAEARPLIRRLGLKPGPGAPAPRLMVGDGTALVVSGTGRVRAAAAVAAAWTRLDATGHAPSAILNTGLCGAADSGRHPRGSVFVINACTDTTCGRRYYPDILLRHSLPEAGLHTFDKVIHSPEEARSGVRTAPELVDMEAAGVFEAGTLFLPASHVHALKIVGDALTDARFVTAADVESLIDDAIESITAFAAALRAFAASSEKSGRVLDESEERALGEAMDALRLTATQRARLSAAARHYRLLHDAPPSPVLAAFAARPPKSKNERAQALDRLLHALNGV